MDNKQSEKTVKMDAAAHSIIKQYCKDNGLKFARFIEKTCLRFIEEETQNNGNKEV